MMRPVGTQADAQEVCIIARCPVPKSRCDSPSETRCSMHLHLGFGSEKPVSTAPALLLQPCPALTMEEPCWIVGKHDVPFLVKSSIRLGPAVCGSFKL